MQRIAQHTLLLEGDSYEHCTQHVHKFFDLTSLVIYDCIEASVEKSSCGLDADFFGTIREAEKKNHQTVQELVGELTKSGIHNICDFHKIEQGYQSKTLHVLTHLLDGFIGIDSYFYNLIDDSHWLPDSTVLEIQKKPSQYWLIHIDCFSATPEEVGIIRL